MAKAAKVVELKSPKGLLTNSTKKFPMSIDDIARVLADRPEQVALDDEGGMRLVKEGAGRYAFKGPDRQEIRKLIEFWRSWMLAEIETEANDLGLYVDLKPRRRLLTLLARVRHSDKLDRTHAAVTVLDRLDSIEIYLKGVERGALVDAWNTILQALLLATNVHQFTVIDLEMPITAGLGTQRGGKAGALAKHGKPEEVQEKYKAMVQTYAAAHKPGVLRTEAERIAARKHRVTTRTIRTARKAVGR